MSAEEKAPPARRLDWDSAWWDLEVAMVERLPRDATDVAALDGWCETHGVDLLMALVPEEDTSTRRLLETPGSPTLDSRITLVHRGPVLAGSQPGPDGITLRLVRIHEASALGDLAACSHRGSHFYEDPRLDDERCSQLYREWIEGQCRSAECLVLVAEDNGVVVGYCSVVDLGGERASIGLLGVADHARRRGIGEALVGECLRRNERAGAEEMTVVTQGANASALRLYERLNFENLLRERWIHRWRLGGGASDHG